MIKGFSVLNLAVFRLIINDIYFLDNHRVKVGHLLSGRTEVDREKNNIC